MMAPAEIRIAPPRGFSRAAYVKNMEEYESLYREAEMDPEGFWARVAGELAWFKPWEQVLDWQVPFAEWFVGGQLNACYNCLDRHISTWRKNKAALIWEGEPGDTRILTYLELYREVCKFANVLKRLGIRPGDRVAIYMPLVPEAVVAMLACARIGAPHTVIFAGFSAEAVRDRVLDAQAKLVITADGGYRRGKVIPLKERVDEALGDDSPANRVIVLQRTGAPVTMRPERDHWWHDLMKDVTASGCPAEPVDSEHPLYILYTSGTTGKPKGILHTTGGYMVGTYYTTKLVFDLKEEDIYWCTADVGWVTGHSYTVYGPMANGATVVAYEGAPDYPEPDRFWKIIEDHQVSIFYTAPTAIRSFMKWGEEWPQRRDLRSLRLLGTVGEPINPAAWEWYNQTIGRGRCPIVDTWWQTETGMIMISPLPGAIPAKPGSGTLPFPGVIAEVVDEGGRPVQPGKKGLLVIRRPWPSMLRGIWGDPKRYQQQYWSQFPGIYLTGDGAVQDEDGYFWLLGRVDDVLNVSGHRLGTAEVESALVSHPTVAEAAVIGRPDEITGQAVVAFVTLRGSIAGDDKLKSDLQDHVGRVIGSFAKPREIKFAAALPKTRSGKIMRRILRKIAVGDPSVGDITTLEDPTLIARLREEED
ncbi:MAG: acetate--CoA ligase [Armatimonadetes bacterium]|nr:acetate--CoA ligase [Armatimonadota bacterium]